MRRRRYLMTAICAILILVLAPGLVGCGGGKPDEKKEEPTVTAISVDATGAKTTFDYEESFSAQGLKVTATMSDGSSKDIALADCIISSPNMSLPGRRSVTVSYSGKTTRYEITVKERYLPPLDATSLLDITGVNEEVAYRVEAENINMAITEAKAKEGDSFVSEANGSAITSGGRYLANYGVKKNYFGFTFTSNEAYDNVTLVLRMANSGQTNISLDSAMDIYLNYLSLASPNALNLEGMVVSTAEDTDELGWQDIVLRGVAIPEGTSTLAFEIKNDTVPYIDYLDFYVGKRYINSVVEVFEKSTYTKEFEDFDLEKIVNRPDMIQAHNLQPGECYIESASTNIEGTSKGTSVAGFTTGTEISTTLRLAKATTLEIIIVAANVGSYKVKENWEFTINGEPLTQVEDKNIQAGDAAQSQYWEWRDTKLGKYNLPAGDHLFVAKVIGGHCNVDIFKFNALSFDEFYIEPDVKVMASGVKHVIEAEDLVYSEGVVVEEPQGNAYHITSGKKSVTGIATANNTFGFMVESIEESEAILNVISAYEGESLVFDDYIETKVNDAVVITGATLVKDEGPEVYDLDTTPIKKYTPKDAYKWNWKTIASNISLEKGMNQITFTIKEQTDETNVKAPRIDKFELIITKFDDGGEFDVPALMKEDAHAVIQGTGEYKIEAENADLSGVSLAKANLNAGHKITEGAGAAAAAITSGLCIGKLGTLGNVIKVYVYSDAVYENVSIKMSMSVGDNLNGDTRKADDMLNFKFNETAFVAGEDVLFTGFNNTYQYWNWEPFVVEGFELRQGINILEIEIKSAPFANIDYFELIV